MVSQAASISAWKAVLLWPSMVAAFSVDRHEVESSSAALRNTAARSSQGQDAHSRRASRVFAIALPASSAPASCHTPMRRP